MPVSRVHAFYKAGGATALAKLKCSTVSLFLVADLNLLLWVSHQALPRAYHGPRAKMVSLSLPPSLPFYGVERHNTHVRAFVH